jgi:hypothetical protein
MERGQTGTRPWQIVSKERIDLALQQLSTLGITNCHPEPGPGWPSTLWAPAGGAKDAGRGKYRKYTDNNKLKGLPLSEGRSYRQCVIAMSESQRQALT